MAGSGEEVGHVGGPFLLARWERVLHAASQQVGPAREPFSSSSLFQEGKNPDQQGQGAFCPRMRTVRPVLYSWTVLLPTLKMERLGKHLRSSFHFYICSEKGISSPPALYSPNSNIADL
ncbi:unnamed protein product [Rangifer tarandus platyrhynchus]|uniref:Uncharacterized protein n=2 Tax=Rangifer tarandus platyrhynchus TaxID=3082113 RepID=A0AC59ZY96_RANTA|nr:unnamed protein product [Rangifer tarandus platyrhynchus]